MERKFYYLEVDKLTHTEFSIRYDKNNKYVYEIARVFNGQDAEYIVQAVNEYQALKEEKEKLEETLIDVQISQQVTQKENKELKDRLQFDPQGSDKIDELEQALEFVKFENEKLRQERDNLLKDNHFIADLLKELGIDEMFKNNLKEGE